MKISRRDFLSTASAGGMGLPLGLCRSSSTETQRDRKPNLLVILSDQQHGKAMGFEDSFFETPAMDALAAEGVVFKNAFCTTPQCSPSRSSLLTGLYPHKTGVIGNVRTSMGDVQDLHHRTVAVHLREAGYDTAYFGKWHLGRNRIGCSGWGAKQWGIRGADLTNRAEKFLNRVEKSEKPFALFLSYTNPHDIYSFNPEIHKKPDEEVPLPPSWSDPRFFTKPSVQEQFMREDQGKRMWGRSKEVWQAYRVFYRSKVRLFDKELGKVLRRLENSGLLDETIVVVTSDHGDMDASHRLCFKGPFMYENLVNVPLIIRLPTRLGGGAHREVSGLVTNADIPPTLLDLAGVREVGPCDGRSLVSVLTQRGDLPEREFVIGQYYSKQVWINPIRMIRTLDWKYNHTLHYGEELYDLRNDPGEIVNLAGDPGYREVKGELSAMLEDWMRENKDPFHSYGISTREGKRIFNKPGEG